MTIKVWNRIKKRGGFWIHDNYGGSFTVYERYSEEKPHEGKFIPLEELEKKYGKIIAVMETADDEDDDSFLIIWTKYNVVFVDEYDGLESIRVLPRNPPKDAERVKRR